MNKMSLNSEIITSNMDEMKSTMEGLGEFIMKNNPTSTPNRGKVEHLKGGKGGSNISAPSLERMEERMMKMEQTINKLADIILKEEADVSGNISANTAQTEDKMLFEGNSKVQYTRYITCVF